MNFFVAACPRPCAPILGESLGAKYNAQQKTQMVSKKKHEKIGIGGEKCFGGLLKVVEWWADERKMAWERNTQKNPRRTWQTLS